MKLELSGIQKSFGEKKVLSGVSLTAQSGQALGLLGRNGAGKTTTIRILMNVFGADGGQVLIDGSPIDYKKISFGYLPEERGLYPKKKVMDQLTYFAELKGMSRRDAARSVEHWLDRLQMSEYKNKRLDTLSKGNQQKIQLVTALAHDPHIVILDEPFSGLDPVNAALLRDVVKETIARGKIVLFSSHQMGYIEEFCDSVAILNGGKIVLSGDLDQIKRQYPRNRLRIRSLQADQIARDLGDKCAFREDGSLLLTMASPAEKAKTISLLAQKYDIDDIGVFEPSLEDIFVEYASERA